QQRAGLRADFLSGEVLAPGRRLLLAPVSQRATAVGARGHAARRGAHAPLRRQFLLADQGRGTLPAWHGGAFVEPQRQPTFERPDTGLGPLRRQDDGLLLSRGSLRIGASLLVALAAAATAAVPPRSVCGAVARWRGGGWRGGGMR